MTLQFCNCFSERDLEIVYCGSCGKQLLRCPCCGHDKHKAAWERYEYQQTHKDMPDLRCTTDT